MFTLPFKPSSTATSEVTTATKSYEIEYESRIQNLLLIGNEKLLAAYKNKYKTNIEFYKNFVANLNKCLGNMPKSANKSKREDKDSEAQNGSKRYKSSNETKSEEDDDDCILIEPELELKPQLEKIKINYNFNCNCVLKNQLYIPDAESFDLRSVFYVILNRIDAQDERIPIEFNILYKSKEKYNLTQDAKLHSTLESSGRLYHKLTCNVTSSHVHFILQLRKLVVGRGSISASYKVIYYILKRKFNFKRLSFKIKTVKSLRNLKEFVLFLDSKYSC